MCVKKGIILDFFAMKENLCQAIKTNMLLNKTALLWLRKKSIIEAFPFFI